MSTIRRFLVLAPFALAVTLLLAVVYMASIGGALYDVGYGLVGACVVNVLVLAVILLAAAALSRSGLGPAAALGAALALVVAVGAVYYVADAPWRGDDEEWDMLILTVGLAASVPAWLTYAVGLLVLHRRDRRAALSEPV